MVNMHIALALLLIAGARAAQPETIAALSADDACVNGECSNGEFSALQRSHAKSGSQSHTEDDADFYAGLETASEWQVAALHNHTETAGLSHARTVFGGGALGAMFFSQFPGGVHLATAGVGISVRLLSDICGEWEDKSEKPTFMYHIHEKFPDDKRYATGAECGSDSTGGHWDPTAACGPASGNPACAKCTKRKQPYQCSPETFDPKNSNQYNPANPQACELGDLSNMFGDLTAFKKLPWYALGGPIPAVHMREMKGRKEDRGYVFTLGKSGVAQMSAKAGTVSLENDPKCKPGGSRFEHAGRNLRELRGRSVVVHCGSQFKNSGARLFCAKIF